MAMGGFVFSTGGCAMQTKLGGGGQHQKASTPEDAGHFYFLRFIVVNDGKQHVIQFAYDNRYLLIS